LYSFGIYHFIYILFVNIAVITGLCGCSDPDRNSTINLSELIVFSEEVPRPEGTLGQYGSSSIKVNRFFDRRTGEEYSGIPLYLHCHHWSPFSEGLAVAQKDADGLAGYVNAAGRVVIPFQYSDASPFHDGLAKVMVQDGEGNYIGGYIDRQGQWVVPPGRHEELGDFREGRIPFRKGKLWGLLDRLGREVVPPSLKTDHPILFRDGLAILHVTDGTFKCIDRFAQTRFTLPAGTYYCYSFHDGMAWVMSDGLDGFLTVSGQIGIPLQEVSYRSFSEGLAPYCKLPEASGYHSNDNYNEYAYLGTKSSDEEPTLGLWGYIGMSGAIAIEPAFDRVGPFSEGLARVCKKGKWGYIDKSGEIIIPLQFKWARDFRNGIAEVWYGSDLVVQFIDSNGKLIVDTGYEMKIF
jgi:hypothetical protein